MSSFPMAGRGPRYSYYAGAYSLSIFSAQGSNPLQDGKVLGKGVSKVYDRSVKGYVYCLSGSLQSKLQLPKDSSKSGLQLLHPFLVLQVFVPRGVHFSVELRVSDTSGTRRKMYFSTSFSDIKSTPLHCQIPISMVIRNKWLSLAFHVADLFNSCFRGAVPFRSIDVIVLGPVCKLRKIFTMRCRMAETNSQGYVTVEDTAGEDGLPQEHLYAVGVDSCVQTLDMATIQSAVPAINDNSAAATAAPTDHDSQHGGGTGPESGLSARKGGGPHQGKWESSKVVHVAFGTRMPLPLSTVQINTNLPHDKAASGHGPVKDRIGRVHFVSDPAATVTAEALGTNKSSSNMPNREPVQLLQQLQKRKGDNGVDASKLLLLKGHRAGHLAKSSWSEGKEHQLLASSDNHPIRVCDAIIGEQPAAAEAIAAEETQIPSSLSRDPPAGSPKFSSAHNQDMSERVAAADGEPPAGPGTQSDCLAAAAASIIQNDYKSPSSKWIPRKREVTLKQQRKDQRTKDYKHTRYEDLDSPPGSPPCGWDRGPGGNQSHDLGFHDHFLDGSWMMNSHFTESLDAESEKKSDEQDEDTLMFDIHDDRFFPGHVSEKNKDTDRRDINLMANDIFTNIQASRTSASVLADSFDFNCEPNSSGKFQEPLQATSTLQLIDTSGHFSCFKLGPVGSTPTAEVGHATPLACDTPKVGQAAALAESDHHFSCTVPSKTEREPVAAEQEHNRPIKSNIRPDDDLDLLYDPTLDCYYDPKTNRYYELK